MREATWPDFARRPRSATASGSSAGRKPGRAVRTTRTRAFCSRAPTPRPSHIEAHVFRLIGLRNLTKAQHGHAPGPEASVTKLYWSEMDKRMQETAIGVEGMYGALAPESAMAIEDGRWQYGWMWAQAETIYAGSSEIQRNIIAERVLGLPRGR